jgi:hypothetical protein
MYASAREGTYHRGVCRIIDESRKADMNGDDERPAWIEIDEAFEQKLVGIADRELRRYEHGQCTGEFAVLGVSGTDVVQSVRIDCSLRGAEGIDNVEAWLTRCVINSARDHRGRARFDYGLGDNHDLSRRTVHGVIRHDNRGRTTPRRRAA